MQSQWHKQKYVNVISAKLVNVLLSSIHVHRLLTCGCQQWLGVLKVTCRPWWVSCVVNQLLSYATPTIRSKPRVSTDRVLFCLVCAVQSTSKIAVTFRYIAGYSLPYDRLDACVIIVRSPKNTASDYTWRSIINHLLYTEYITEQQSTNITARQDTTQQQSSLQQIIKCILGRHGSAFLCRDGQKTKWRLQCKY